MVPARLAEAVLPTVASLPATKLRYFQFAALGVKMCVQVEKMVVSILVSTGRMLAETYYAPPVHLQGDGGGDVSWGRRRGDIHRDRQAGQKSQVDVGERQTGRARVSCRSAKFSKPSSCLVWSRDNR